MGDRIDRAAQGAIAIPAVAAQVSYPNWAPSLERMSEVAAQWIPIFGAIAGALYALNMGVSVVRNWRAARDERRMRDEG